MSKDKKLIQVKSKSTDIEREVMSKLTSGEVVLKPKWLFVAGSALTMAGLVGLTFGSIFLTNLTIFLIKKRGPGYGKLELMLESFPIWVPILAVLAIISGILILKKYDFSYKKNFLLIIISFVASIIIAGFLVDQFGLNTVWSHQGPMGRFYQRLESHKGIFPKGQGQGRMKDSRNNGYHYIN